MNVTRWERAAMMAAVVLAAGGCTIADVTAAGGDDRLGVEAVLRADSRVQAVLLHRSVQGALVPGEQGAGVAVTGPDGVQHVFAEATLQRCLKIDPAYLDAEEPVDIQGTCYLSRDDEGHWVRPGATYTLRVETRRGEVAQAQTRVPGAFSIRTLPFRSRDDQAPVGCGLASFTSLPVVWTQSAGAYGYIAPLRVFGLPDVVPDTIPAPNPLELIGVAVSSSDTTLLLPTEFGVFDRFSLDLRLLRYLQAGLPAGVVAEVTVAAADRNYINGVRGGSFNPSGQVRVSSIAGDGVGVFGSVVPLRTIIHVPGGAGVPKCM